MPSSIYTTAGRILMTFVGLNTSIACYIADYNETHVFNPRWPPHARFHNGQTMSLGLTLGLLTQYLVWRPTFNPRVDTKDSSFLAAVVASLYWVAGLSAILYPGTAWSDPEFGGDGPQAIVFSVCLALAWVGYWMISQGTDGAGKARKSV